jgi:hypothetical protein
MGQRPVRTGRRRRYLTFGKWALIDQGLSSGTNFLLAILVVRSVSTADFGAFSLVALLYVVSLGATRAVTTEPLAIRFGRAVDAIRERTPNCLGLALALGAVGGAACVLAAAATGGTLRSVLLILGFTLPLLVVQDAGRVICFAMGMPRRAAANDALWALIELPVVAAVVVQDDPPTSWYVAAWLVPGALAGIFMLYQLAMRPLVRHAGDWFAESRSLGVPLLWNYGLTTAPPYLLFALTPLVSSLSDLGLAKAAYLPYGVFGVVFQSAWLVLVPAAARRTGTEMARLATWSSAALGGLALAWSTILILAVPAALGVTVFGTTWNETGDLRLVFGAALTAQAAGVGPMVGLRGLEAPKLLVRVRLATSPLMVVGGLVLTIHFGAIGLALAILFGDLSTSLLSWVFFRRASRGLGGERASDIDHQRVGRFVAGASDRPTPAPVDPSFPGTGS